MPSAKGMKLRILERHSPLTLFPNIRMWNSHHRIPLGWAWIPWSCRAWTKTGQPLMMSALLKNGLPYSISIRDTTKPKGRAEYLFNKFLFPVGATLSWVGREFDETLYLFGVFICITTLFLALIPYYFMCREKGQPWILWSYTF